jgi:hypothetical protein
MAVRALQGCRATYQTAASEWDVLAITTQDGEGKVYLLASNVSPAARTVDADPPALITDSTGTLWEEYSAEHLGEIVGSSPTLDSGHIVFEIPATGAALIEVMCN